MSEISLSGGLERVSRTGYNNSKNREKNILIIYAPWKGLWGLIKFHKILSWAGRKSEGKRGVGGGCGNVVNPIGFSIISTAGARGERGR